jgi:hypothetical protein
MPLINLNQMCSVLLPTKSSGSETTNYYYLNGSSSTQLAIDTSQIIYNERLIGSTKDLSYFNIFLYWSPLIQVTSTQVILGSIPVLLQGDYRLRYITSSKDEAYNPGTSIIVFLLDPEKLDNFIIIGNGVNGPSVRLTTSTAATTVYKKAPSAKFCPKINGIYRTFTIQGQWVTIIMRDNPNVPWNLFCTSIEDFPGFSGTLNYNATTGIVSVETGTGAVRYDQSSDVFIFGGYVFTNDGSTPPSSV